MEFLPKRESKSAKRIGFCVCTIDVFKDFTDRIVRGNLQAKALALRHAEQIMTRMQMLRLIEVGRISIRSSRLTFAKKEFKIFCLRFVFSATGDSANRWIKPSRICSEQGFDVGYVQIQGAIQKKLEGG